MQEAALQQPDRLERFVGQDYPRTITLKNDLKIDSIHRIEGLICKYESESDEPIVFEFNTNGGSFIPCMRLCHVLRGMRVPRYGVVRGNCFSSGWMILQFCEWRVSTRNSRFLLHSNFSSVKLDGDTVPEALYELAKREVPKHRAWREDFINFVIDQRPEFTFSGLLEIMRKDRIMNAHEAKRFGFVDQIV